MATKLSDKQHKIGIIGSGFAGLCAAALLAKNKQEVHVFEKNASLGGRARQFETDGFTFDMGPSWYWMPEVLENFFALFGKKTSDYFELVELDPGFQMIFKDKETLRIPANWEDLCALFEEIETGSAKKLKKFMEEAEYKYKVGMEELVYQPGLSFSELLKPELIKGIFRLDVFSSFSKHVRSYFKNPKLIALMEFPILFLGAMPKDTPALYSLMNYAGLKVGTFYPMGGFGKVIEGLTLLAKEQGVQFHTDSAITEILVSNGRSTGIKINEQQIDLDGIIGAADYEHIEDKLLPKELRNYSKSYWEKRVFAPSALLFYLGVNKKIKNLEHHSLFFDEDLDAHATDIYKNKVWPEQALFYACCPSKTDPSVAPDGSENLFLLMPVAVGIEDTEEIREKYFQRLIKRLESYTGESISDAIVYKKSYCINDFQKDYNAYKGNAYGLANTLMQTANLKPSIRNKKVENLFYAGQLTVPGPGVPPSIISGQVAAKELLKYLKSSK